MKKIFMFFHGWLIFFAVNTHALNEFHGSDLSATVAIAIGNEYLVPGVSHKSRKLASEDDPFLDAYIDYSDTLAECHSGNLTADSDAMDDYDSYDDYDYSDTTSEIDLQLYSPNLVRQMLINEGGFNEMAMNAAFGASEVNNLINTLYGYLENSGQYWINNATQFGASNNASTTCTTQSNPKEKQWLTLHTIDVGQALCQVVETSGSLTDKVLPRVLVSDCGYGLKETPATGHFSKYQAALRVQLILWRTWLRSRLLFGKAEQPALTLSHPDLDHYKIIHLAMLGWRPSYTLLGSHITDYKNKNFVLWHRTIDNKTIWWNGTAHSFNTGSNSHALDVGNAKVKLLVMNEGYFNTNKWRRNRDSIILKLSQNNFSAVLTGDAYGSTEAGATSNQSGRVNILTASHHGSNTYNSNSQNWIDATTPDVVLYSAGALSRYGHARCDVYDRIQNTSYLEDIEFNIGQWSLDCYDNTNWQTHTSLTDSIPEAQFSTANDKTISVHVSFGITETVKVTKLTGSWWSSAETKYLDYEL